MPGVAERSDPEIERIVVQVLDRLGLGANVQSLLASRFLIVPSAGRSFCSFGINALTWPGGSSTSDTITVDHDLGAIPESVQATLFNSTSYVAFRVAAGPTDTQFQISGRTIDGSTPLVSQTDDFYWWAVGG